MNSKILTQFVNYRRRNPGLPLAWTLVSLALGWLSPGSAPGASFQFTGSMTSPRQAHTATLLPNGQVLVTGGWDGTTNLASAELFDPANGTWSLTSSMGFKRAWHTATLLPSGKVLVAGGYDVYDPSNVLATEEVYDPATGLWSAIAPMASKRSSHTASLLPNGQVLVAGGYDGTNDLSTAELYDPVSGTWSPTASMTTPRDSHTATSLPNGQVLVVGGYFPPAKSSAEIYDPVTGTWTATAGPKTPRQDHTATLLPNGLVLVAGGGFFDAFNDYSSLNNAELYDPETGTWADTAPMVHRRYGHAATLLASGLVLVTGGAEFFGFDGIGTLSISELYDPRAATWTEAQTMRSAREYHSATMLANGKVLIAGGGYWDSPDKILSAELYDARPNPDGGTWSPTDSMSIPRIGHTATLLRSGQVLVAGGYDGTNDLSTAELYDPVSGAWTSTGSMSDPRVNHTATLLLNGKVLIVGEYDAEIYDPTSETWAFTGAMATPHNWHTATLLFNGKVLVAGGYDDTGQPSSAEVYDPDTEEWTTTGVMKTNRFKHTATLLPDGKVFVSGGVGLGVSPNDLNNAELYDPVSGAWAPTDSMRWQRSGHTATLLPTGKVFVIGGTDNQYPSGVSELYDPGAGRWLDTSPRQDGGFDFEFPATLLRNGTVLVAGGNNEAIARFPQMGREVFSVAEVYEPGTDTWSEVAFMTSPRTLHTATLLSDGRVLVTGGVWQMDVPVLFTDMVSPSAELYQPGGNTNPVPVRPKLISSTLADGAFEFRFLSLPLTTFTVLATTNASLPVSDWTVLGGATEFAPGLYQFTDPNASNYAQRYYCVRSP